MPISAWAVQPFPRWIAIAKFRRRREQARQKVWFDLRAAPPALERVGIIRQAAQWWTVALRVS